MEYEFSYTITVFKADDEARKFVSWYNEVWLKKNPAMDDFTLTFENDSDMGEVLEVMAHNPFLSAETILDIFERDSAYGILRLQPNSSSIN